MLRRSNVEFEPTVATDPAESGTANWSVWFIFVFWVTMAAVVVVFLVVVVVVVAIVVSITNNFWAVDSYFPYLLLAVHFIQLIID